MLEVLTVTIVVGLLRVLEQISEKGTVVVTVGSLTIVV